MLSDAVEPNTAPAADRDAAFRRFVVPELEVMLRVARRLTSDHHQAEDLVQEAVLRAYRALDRFDGRHPRAWLLTILRNVWKNSLRKRSVTPVDVGDELADRTPAHGADGRTGPEEHVLHDVLDAAVAAALARVSDAYRTAVELVDIDGLSYREAAEVLGVPEGTVMSRVHRGRTQIREHLRRVGHLSGGTPA